MLKCRSATPPNRRNLVPVLRMCSHSAVSLLDATRAHRFVWAVVSHHAVHAMRVCPPLSVMPWPRWRDSARARRRRRVGRAVWEWTMRSNQSARASPDMWEAESFSGWEVPPIRRICAGALHHARTACRCRTCRSRRCGGIPSREIVWADGAEGCDWPVQPSGAIRRQRG